MPGYLKTPLFLSLLALFFCTNCKTSTSEHNDEKPISSTTDSTQVSQPPGNSPSTTTIKKLPEWPSQAKSEQSKRYPFDEGTNNPDFATFREKLYEATIQKDIKFLSEIIHLDIKFSFGAENGKTDFLKSWQLDKKPNESMFWKELETILSLGGAFWDETKNSFCAPYVFMLDDIDDPYNQAVIVGEKVRLREQPNSNAKITSSLSWDLVEFVDQEDFVEETINGETHPWKKIKTSTNQVGYVFAKYIRSPIDFRAGFSNKEGQWMMDLFIAGD